MAANRLIPIVFACALFHNFLTIGTEGTDHKTSENYTIKGWTVPVICPRSTLCNVDPSNCSSVEPDTRTVTCGCDPACHFFNDCCADYFQNCKIREVPMDEFGEAIEDIQLQQFSCMVPGGNKNSWKALYMLVSQCNPEWDDHDRIKEKCEGIIDEKNSFVPVVYNGHISFRNIYCVLCNYKNVSDIYAWTLVVDCQSSLIHGHTFLEITEICSAWYFKLPGSITAGRPCHNVSFDSCEVDSTNETLVSLSKTCESYSGIFSQLYTNPHCYLCYELLTSNLSYWDIYGNLSKFICPYEFSANFTPKDNDSVLLHGKTPKPIFGNTVAVLFDFTSTDKWPQGFPGTILCADWQKFDPSTWMCVNLVTCPLGYILSGGSCHRRELPDRTCANESSVPISIHLECHLDSSMCVPNIPLVASADVVSILYETFGFSGNLSVSEILSEQKETRDSATIRCTHVLNMSGSLKENVVIPEIELDNIFAFATRMNPFNLTYRLSLFHMFIGCPNTEDVCPNDFHSFEGFEKILDNGTSETFFVVDNTTYTIRESFYKLQYIMSDTLTSYLKNETLEVCKQSRHITCSFVALNASLFQDIGDGSLLFLSENKTLSPGEFIKEDDERILVCSSFIGHNNSLTGFMNFSRNHYILNIVLLSLSNICLFFTFTTFWKLEGHRKSTGKQLIMNLCVALILGQLTLLIKGIPSLSQNACKSVAVAGHFVWLSVFSSTTSLAIDLHRRFGVRSMICKGDETAEVLAKFLLFSWGTPLFVVAPCVGIYFSGVKFPSFNLSYGGGTCWLGDGRANLYVFGVPVGAFILTNCILFITVAIGLHRVRRNSALRHVHNTGSGLSSDFLIYVKISTLLGFTWLLGFVAAIVDVSALWYGFIVLNSLQGVFIFVAFACNKRVVELWRNVCVLSVKQTASAHKSTSKMSLCDKPSASRCNDNGQQNSML